MPDWTELLHRRNSDVDEERRPAPVTPIDPTRATRYAATALAREVEAVSTAPEGTRNDTLNRAGFNLAQLVAAGHLDENDVRVQLTSAARYAGLDSSEIGATLASSLGAGSEHPRVVADLPPLPEVSTITRPTDGVTEQPPEDGDGTSVRERLPIIDWHELWATENDDEWIVEPLLPARRLVALYSAPKVGKSLLMLEVAVGVARGERVLGYQTDRPRRVLYVDFENDPRGDVRERLRSMRYEPDDLSNLCYMSYPRLAKLDTAFGAIDLMAAVAEYECEVVVIDTISRAVGGEENENDTWLSFYRHTGMALKAGGVACIRLDHTGKDVDKGMRGGSAKYGDVDAVWRLSRITDTTYRLDCTDNRLPITEKELVIRRDPDPPLRHVVQAEGRVAAHRAKVDELVSTLDQLDAAKDIGRPGARDLLAANGLRARNDVLTEALRQRRIRLQVFTVDDDE